MAMVWFEMSKMLWFYWLMLVLIRKGQLWMNANNGWFGLVWMDANNGWFGLDVCGQWIDSLI